MKELVNFIPKTFAECKSLLARIKGQTSAVVEDRYLGQAELDEEEIKALVALLENQIGESAEPAAAPEAPAEEAPAEETKAEEVKEKKVTPKKSVKK